MSGLRERLDAARERFRPGAPLGRLRPLFDLVDTFLYTPGRVTVAAPHARDAVDLKRVMIVVVIALLPCIAMALYNTGYQANRAISLGGDPLPGWRTTVFEGLGLTYDPESLLSSVVHGGLYFLPALVVCFAAGGVVEVLFAVVRGHGINEGFFVTGFLIPLTLPPTIPLWQVALGTAFGVAIGKEVFGGTGMNFLNPALVSRAFLFFSYPAGMSGEVWTAARLPDVVSGATPLAVVAGGETLSRATSWTDAVIGRIPGSMGETSFLACALGALVLIVTRVASWRTMLGVVLGTAAIVTLLSLVPGGEGSMLGLPLTWHVVLGGWAFGTVFMATDPVSSPLTQRGQLAYGVGIGALTVLVRAVNPAYPEGMMLAILFMNVFASTIDHFVVRANIARRKARYAATTR